MDGIRYIFVIIFYKENNTQNYQYQYMTNNMNTKSTKYSIQVSKLYKTNA